MKRTFTRQRITRAAMTLLVTMLTAATAWADDVNLSVDNDIAEGTAGHWYVNMPKTGTNTLTLSDASVTTFKVYDDGGKGGSSDIDSYAGNYSNNSSGTLVLTAPTGYVFQLSGSIKTESRHDYLSVYDGSDNSGTQLLNEVRSTNGGVTTAITTVVSGQSMTLYFYSDGSSNNAGLDLTVTLASTDTEYGISVNNATGGSVAASVDATSASAAKVKDIVTLTATPSEGCVLSGISVKDANNNAVAMTWNVWTNTATFTMPASAVTVTPTFTNDLTSLSINMPKKGTKSATIPEGVTSFKVYDDGGSTGKYSYQCDGTLVLTAPTGYVLQLSGDIYTENNADYLTVYDNSEASGIKLLNQVSANPKIDITTVVSSGQSMTLYFHSDGSYNYDGLDLTVTLISTSEEFGITVNDATGGSVAASVGGYATPSALCHSHCLPSRPYG